MKIDRHISELLYDHDCVIVPSFGGFLASYQSAQLQSNHHTFYPPSKKIAFNVYLKNNDGLLANYVADKEKFTYAEALKDIDRFRMEAIKLLDSGKRLIVEDVGILFYDKHNNLQFEPHKHINYLQEAFGLSAVQSPPVKREEQRKKIERQIREAVSIRSSVKPPRAKSYSKLTPAWKAFNTVVLSVAVVWFAFNIYLITPHHADISSLNPFSYSTSPSKVETPDSGTKAESPQSAPSPAQTQKAAEPIITPPPADNKQPSQDNSVAMVNPPAPKEEAVPAKTTVQSEKNFFVIAGVFREPGNAEKFVATLQQEGFSDAQIVNPESSVKKVSYSSFATRKEAWTALEQIHAAKKDGWILVK